MSNIQKFIKGIVSHGAPIARIIVQVYCITELESEMAGFDKLENRCSCNNRMLVSALDMLSNDEKMNEMFGIGNILVKSSINNTYEIDPDLIDVIEENLDSLRKPKFDIKASKTSAEKLFEYIKEILNNADDNDPEESNDVCDPTSAIIVTDSLPATNRPTVVEELVPNEPIAEMTVNISADDIKMASETPVKKKRPYNRKKLTGTNAVLVDKSIKKGYDPSLPEVKAPDLDEVKAPEPNDEEETLVENTISPEVGSNEDAIEAEQIKKRQLTWISDMIMKAPTRLFNDDPAPISVLYILHALTKTNPHYRTTPSLNRPEALKRKHGEPDWFSEAELFNVINSVKHRSLGPINWTGFISIDDKCTSLNNTEYNSIAPVLVSSRDLMKGLGTLLSPAKNVAFLNIESIIEYYDDIESGESYEDDLHTYYRLKPELFEAMREPQPYGYSIEGNLDNVVTEHLITYHRKVRETYDCKASMAIYHTLKNRGLFYPILYKALIGEINPGREHWNLRDLAFGAAQTSDLGVTNCKYGLPHYTLFLEGIEDILVRTHELHLEFEVCIRTVIYTAVNMLAYYCTMMRCANNVALAVVSTDSIDTLTRAYIDNINDFFRCVNNTRMSKGAINRLCRIVQENYLGNPEHNVSSRCAHDVSRSEYVHAYNFAVSRFINNAAIDTCASSKLFRRSQNFVSLWMLEEDSFDEFYDNLGIDEVDSLKDFSQLKKLTVERAVAIMKRHHLRNNSNDDTSDDKTEAVPTAIIIPTTTGTAQSATDSTISELVKAITILIDKLDHNN